MPLIALKDVCLAFGGQEVLHGINLAIEKGEIITVIGPNGSGKTSLIRLIIGAAQPSHGKIKRKRGLRIGYVPQKLHIDPALPISAEGYLRLVSGRDQNAITRALEDAEISHVAARPMNKLSGGQFQRVLLAAALLDRPDLLILDEATQGLDQAGSAAFYDKITEIRAEKQIAILMVSHDLHVVMRATDRVICLNHYICCQGQPEAVSSAPEYQALFGAEAAGTLALYRHHDRPAPEDLNQHLHESHHEHL